MSSENLPDLTGLSPRKALATFTEWLERQRSAGRITGDLERPAEFARLSLNEVVLNANNPDALKSSQKNAVEKLAQFTEAWNTRSS